MQKTQGVCSSKTEFHLTFDDLVLFHVQVPLACMYLPHDTVHSGSHIAHCCQNLAMSHCSGGDELRRT
jgi:hypothetical protein